MKPFDDMIPEEMEPDSKELLALLQRTTRRSASITPVEQEQIIAKVRERLLLSRINATDEDLAVQQPEMVETTPRSQATFPIKARGRRRVFHVMNTLAAVLVVGAIIGASLLLFTHRSLPGGSMPAGQVGIPVTARSQAGGLEMTMILTPGPYFLSEMLSVDLSLTNHTHTTYFVGVPFAASSCGYVTGVEMAGGGSPHYEVPIPTQHSCPADSNNVPLRPGDTLTARKYMPLTSSGHVTLTAIASFPIKIVDAKGNVIGGFPSPFVGHWPSIGIYVNSRVPADRKLSFRVEGSYVLVIAPPGARSHLVYLYSILCGNGITGDYAWYPLSMNEVSIPACPGKENLHWAFAFGAPGYAVVSGTSPPS